MSHCSDNQMTDEAGLFLEVRDTHLPITITHHSARGWVSLRSQLLELIPAQGRLIIEYPGVQGQFAVEFAGGEAIGLTFRRGHVRCVCDTVVARRLTHYTASGAKIPALEVNWPDEVRELQRRLFYRAPVPVDMVIPVDLRQNIYESGATAPAETYRGTMMDLSAGGLCVLLPSGEGVSPFESGDEVVCRFAVPEDRILAETAARCCHVDDFGKGQLRIGVQFIGLDASAEGRATLSQIARLTTRFQHLEFDSDESDIL